MATNKIYIDIQSLLDIRQSVLVEMMGEEKALEYVSSDLYNFRETDIFPVNQEEYKHRMNSKTPAVFKNSTITYNEVILKSKLASLEKLNGFNSESAQPELIVNTYPYQLTKEQVRHIQNAIFIKMDLLCVITVVYDSPAVWSPSYIRNNNVSSFFMYNFSEWMGFHSDKLVNGDLREINIFVPAVGAKELTDEEHKNFKKLGFTDVFSYTEYVLSSVCRIQFLPIIFYTNIVTATAILDKNKGHVEKHIQKFTEEQKEATDEQLREKGIINDNIT